MTIRCAVYFIVFLVIAPAAAQETNRPWTNIGDSEYPTLLEGIESIGVRSIHLIGHEIDSSLATDIDGLTERIRKELEDNEVRTSNKLTRDVLSTQIVLRRLDQGDQWLVFAVVDFIRLVHPVKDAIQVGTGRPVRYRYLQPTASLSSVYRVSQFGIERRTELVESLYVNYIEPLIARFIADYYTAN
jgi:hypothetical protein